MHVHYIYTCALDLDIAFVNFVEGSAITPSTMKHDFQAFSNEFQVLILF